MNKADIIKHLSDMAADIDAKGEKQIAIGHYTIAREGKCRADALRYAIAKIEQLICHEWISVDERLPSKCGGYITCDKDGEVKGVYFSLYNDKSFAWTDGEFDVATDSVTHWQELPEPPK